LSTGGSEAYRPYTSGPMFRRVFSTLNWVALTPLAARAPMYGRLLMELVADKRIPLAHKAILGVAAGYLVVPIDVVPDFIPVVGRLDDVAIVVLALDLFLEAVPPALLQEKLHELEIDGRQLERDLERMRRFVPRPVRAIVRRLPDLVDRAVRVARGMVGDRVPTARPATEEAPA
jgi:uncharacterized membrane protein YkvA (DUF1232 family)